MKIFRSNECAPIFYPLSRQYREPRSNVPTFSSNGKKGDQGHFTTPLKKEMGKLMLIHHDDGNSSAGT
jgi:hypothetical protein